MSPPVQIGLITDSLHDSYLKHKICRLKWERNTDRPECGRIITGGQPIRFQNQRSEMPYVLWSCKRGGKGPVKLIEWVTVALLFSHVTSKLFKLTIFNLSG